MLDGRSGSSSNLTRMPAEFERNLGIAAVARLQTSSTLDHAALDSLAGPTTKNAFLHGAAVPEGSAVIQKFDPTSSQAVLRKNRFRARPGRRSCCSRGARAAQGPADAGAGYRAGASRGPP